MNHLGMASDLLLEPWNLSIIFLPFVCVLVAQLCPTLWDPVDYSLPGSILHGILQARTLEWVAVPFSMGPSQPRDQAQVS